MTRTYAVYKLNYHQGFVCPDTEKPLFDGKLFPSIEDALCSLSLWLGEEIRSVDRAYAKGYAIVRRIGGFNE